MFVLTACLAALVIWKGRLHGLLQSTVFTPLLAVLTLPVLGAWLLGLFLMAWLENSDSTSAQPRPFRWAAGSICIAFGTAISLWFHIPTKLQFAVHERLFQRLVERAPVATSRHGYPLGEKLGCYLIDRYGRDPRGGVFFSTYSVADGLGPDKVTYGFVFKPNKEGTIFGNASYRRSRLFGDWWVFSVSDDS
jgi:hypothetical protein